MILTILKIRSIQAWRLIKLMGLIRTIILMILVAFGSLLLFNYLKQDHHSKFVPIIALLIILSIHISRKDKRFLKINFKNNYLIFLTEYFLLVFPLICISIIFKDLKSILIIFLICFSIPRIYLNLGLGNVSVVLSTLLIPFKSNLKFKFNIKIPIQNPRAFELISGFRRIFIFFIPFYILILTFSFKGYVAPIGMIIISFFISGFYFYGESREFIELFSRNYKTFVFEKIKLNLKYLFILFAPIVLISLSFQPETWYFILISIIISSFIQVITIIIKYALFIENSDLSHNGILVFFNVLCVLLPFLWPLPIVMCIRYYKKANFNLKNYLNDIN
jgi:hypothetical protein